MRPSFTQLLSVVTAVIMMTAPGTVTACEGDCIVQVTNVFVTNYTLPVHRALFNVADQIVDKLLPDEAHRTQAHTLSYLEPIVSAYTKGVYGALEKSIFPGYFHGKCQRVPANSNGPPVDPPGCPNPDCPVVCGTPGSMVHFYSTLLHIAFKAVEGLLVELAQPKSEAYREVEKGIMAAVAAGKHEVHPRLEGFADGIHAVHPNATGEVTRERRGPSTEEKTKEVLGTLLKEISPQLEMACGGKGSDALTQCSWEQEMKAYILSFP